MAFVSRVSTLRIDDTSTHLLFRQWVASAANQDTAEGGSVNITITQDSASGGPGQADTLTLNIYNASNVLIRSYALDAASTNQVVSFSLTVDGQSGSAARHGTCYIDIRATLGGVGGYDVETDGSPNTTAAAHHAHTLDRGWIRGTTTLVEGLSNVSAGGGKNEPGSYTSAGGDSLFVRCTLGSVGYVARALTVAISSGGPSGSTSSTTATTRDATFTGVVDNRFPLGVTSVGVTVTAPNDANTGAAYTAFSSVTDDVIHVDPRLSISQHAQRVSPRVNGGNQTLYVISAHQLFVWTHVANARGENVQGVTVTQRIKDGPTVVVSDATKVTGSDGWTPASTPPDFTTAVAAPEGNRTQEGFSNAPADAVGLGTGTQTIAFSSAFTGDKFPFVTLADEIPIGVATRIVYEYRKSDGTRQALDSAAQIRIYSVDSAGDEVEAVALTNMTQFTGRNAYFYDWTPSTAGTYSVEVRATFQGGVIEGGTPVTVRPRFALRLGPLTDRM